MHQGTTTYNRKVDYRECRLKNSFRLIGCIFDWLLKSVSYILILSLTTSDNDTLKHIALQKYNSRFGLKT